MIETFPHYKQMVLRHNSTETNNVSHNLIIMYNLCNLILKNKQNQISPFVWSVFLVKNLVNSVMKDQGKLSHLAKFQLIQSVFLVKFGKSGPSNTFPLSESPRADVEMRIMRL